MKKFLDSDWLRGVQFYFKLHCMQCKLTKQAEQRLETSRNSHMASGNLVPWVFCASARSSRGGIKTLACEVGRRALAV